MARSDGREGNQLRPPRAELGSLSRCDGSCRLTQGSSEVLAGVFGPAVPRRSSQESAEGPAVEVVVRSGTGGALASERVLEILLQDVITRAVVKETYPYSVLSVSVHILHDDGAIAACVLNAVTLALVDAGVELLGLPAGAVVVAQGATILLDATKVEEGVAQNTCFLAIFDREADEEDMTTARDQDDILAIEFTGRASRDLQRQMVTAGISAAQAARSFMRRTLAAARGRMPVWRLPSGSLQGKPKN